MLTTKIRATPLQVRAYQKLSENWGKLKPEPIGKILAEVGYSKSVAKSPTLVTKSKGFQELLEERLPDSELLDVHEGLLKSTRIEHMVFPLGPAGEDDINLSGSTPNADNAVEKAGEDDINLSGSTPNADNAVEKAGVKVERTTLTDSEIKVMLADVGATVKRIVHGQTARHVYFWVANDKARHDALKLAYDIKGKVGQKEPAGNLYQTFIQQNNLDPNSPKARKLVEATMVVLREQTKRVANEAAE